MWCAYTPDVPVPPPSTAAVAHGRGAPCHLPVGGATRRSHLAASTETTRFFFFLSFFLSFWLFDSFPHVPFLLAESVRSGK